MRHLAIAVLFSAVVLGFLWTEAAAAEPLRTGELSLTLDGGIVAVDKTGQARAQRIELDFTIRDGKWEIGRAHV